MPSTSQKDASGASQQHPPSATKRGGGTAVKREFSPGIIAPNSARRTGEKRREKYSDGGDDNDASEHDDEAVSPNGPLAFGATPTHLMSKQEYKEGGGQVRPCLPRALTRSYDA